jgi:hypothetical protein
VSTFLTELVSIEALLTDITDMESVVHDYSDLIKHVYSASRPLDDHMQAKDFASGLLPILKLATSAGYLRDSLESGKTETMVEVLQNVVQVQ